MSAQLEFTDRTGGVSAAPYDTLNLSAAVGDDPARVAANRSLLGARYPGRELVWMEQVHGAGVEVVTPGHAGQLPATDGLVSASPGVVLAVCVADCVPLLMCDDGAGVVAAVHVGRAGMVAGVVAAAVAAMTGLAGRPERIRAELGPCIGPCCYEVPALLRAEVAAAVPGSAATTSRGSPSVDLRAGVCAQLSGLGVGAVRVVGLCTYESPAHFSYRRDGQTGRSAGLVSR